MTGLWNNFFSGLATHTKKKKNKGPVGSKITLSQYEELIQIKKEKNRWEKNHRSLFLSIGLCLSLLMVIAAFNWKSPNTDALADLGQVGLEANEILDIPISHQPPPPPPKKVPQVFTIEEVKDEELIEEVTVDLDVEVNEETKIAEVVFEPVEEVEEESETVFTVVETPPSPVGGTAAFYEYVSASMKYPGMASRLGVSGRVFVEFIVEKDGSLTDITVVKGIGAGCDEEAVRVLENAPKWNPGKQRGMPVRVKMILPIMFILKNS